MSSFGKTVGKTIGVLALFVWRAPHSLSADLIIVISVGCSGRHGRSGADEQEPGHHRRNFRGGRVSRGQLDWEECPAQ